MSKNKPSNYEAFIKKRPGDSAFPATNALEEFRNEVNSLSGLPLGILPAFYILNYETKQYEFVSKDFQCYPKHKAEELLEGGMEKFLSFYQKDDFELYSNQIFSKNLEIILNTPPEEKEQLLFFNTYRILNGDNSISHVLQKNRIIADPKTRLPCYAYGSITDLTHQKLFNGEIHHRIEKTDNQNPNKKTILLSENYKIYDQDKKLTSQEKRVLELLIKGLTTKEIAYKLFISYHTVNTHRKNLLKKTNSKNVIQLITNVLNSNL